MMMMMMDGWKITMPFSMWSEIWFQKFVYMEEHLLREISSSNRCGKLEWLVSAQVHPKDSLNQKQSKNKVVFLSLFVKIENERRYFLIPNWPDLYVFVHISSHIIRSRGLIFWKLKNQGVDLIPIIHESWLMLCIWFFTSY